MKKFLVIYYAAPSAVKAWGKMTPEQKKKGWAEWMAWKKKAGKKLVTFGNPLGKGATVSKKKTGPGRKDVCGYSIVKGRNIADVKKLLKQHPHIKWRATCSLEAYEIMPMH